MKQVLEAIERERRKQEQEHPLMKRLQQSGTLEELVAFAPTLMFFVGAFQDLSRLNSVAVQDPRMKEMALRHRKEDRGHELWLIKDLNALGIKHDYTWLFGPENQVTRDTAYQMVSEILRPVHDALRITMLLVLESTGDALFSRTPGFFERSGFKGPLAFFSRHHHSVEVNHVLFQGELNEYVANLELAPEVRAEAIALVERSFSAIGRMEMVGFERMEAVRARQAATPQVA